MSPADTPDIDYVQSRQLACDVIGSRRRLTDRIQAKHSVDGFGNGFQYPGHVSVKSWQIAFGAAFERLPTRQARDSDHLRKSAKVARYIVKDAGMYGTWRIQINQAW